MDIVDTLIRLSAKFGKVGKTARIAANTYTFIQQNTPNLSHNEILYTIIEYRYKNKIREKSIIYEHLEHVKNRRGELGLDSIVTTILMNEAGYAEKSIHVREILKQVIDEVLIKSGLSKTIVYGERLGTLMDRTIPMRNPLEAFVKNTAQPTLLENANEVNQHINALYSAHNQTNITHAVQAIIESGYDLESFAQLIYERTDIDTAKNLESKLLSVKLPSS